MSFLKSIVHQPNSTPVEADAHPDSLIAGHPHYRTWEQDVCADGCVTTGTWEATPGEHWSRKGDTFEFCHLLEGVIELTPEDGEPIVYRAGDSFVMKPGFVGIWKTIETVRKIYVTVSKP